MSYSDLHVRVAEELQEFCPSTAEPFFFSFPFSDTSSVNSVDILPDFAEFQTQVPVDEPDLSSVSFYDLVGSDFSYSCLSPCHRLENLSIYPSDSNRSHPLTVPQNGDHIFRDVGIIKMEKLDSNKGYCDEAFSSRSYNDPEDFNYNMMQRNGMVYENQDLGNVGTFSDGWMDSPLDGFDGLFGRQIRRACSMGDLQSMRARASSPSPLAGETSLHVSEPNAKAVRCSVEERKEKILKYRAKRTQRNFNKTIKYACRKTLADNRPRVHGRFARNDEVGVPGKAAFLANNDEEDNFWVCMHEEEEEEEEEFWEGVDELQKFVRTKESLGGKMMRNKSKSFY